ncbi:MAG: disulfide bond formation protein B [Methylobacter sp.]|nr:MAG: disulfide bond formation protein B [Methylobacter sp.]
MLELLRFTPRIWFFWGFLGCVFLLGMGAYFQFVDGLEPCPLCISQRIGILLTGLCFLAAAIHNPQARGIRIYSIAGAVLALSGGAVSARHVWIQHLPPDKVPECGPGLEYVFQNFPLSATIKLMLNGSGDCAEVNWQFLGFSMPAWTLLAFLLLAALSLLQLWNTDRDPA